jgi:hypothetical protein
MSARRALPTRRSNQADRMTELGTEAGTHAKCPYCGCGFVRAEAGQVYCGPWCEQQHNLESGGGAGQS